MFCPNCGTRCDDTHHFCYLCGTTLPILAEAAPIMEPKPVVISPISEPAPEDPNTPVTEDEGSPAQAIPAVEGVTAEEECPYVIPTEHPTEAPVPKKGRIWPPILALALMICVGLAVFFASSAVNPDAHTPSWYEIENGVLYFHSEYYTGSEELTIPETLNGQTVTAIGDNAFIGCEGITTVILPKTITAIGDYAFSSCHDLRGIYIPETVQSIGIYAFADCDSLEAIYFPGMLQSIGHGALDSCDTLHYILFDGTYAQWNKLYSGIFASNVELHTTDGTYYARP